MVVYEIMTNEVLYKGYNRYQVYRDVIQNCRPEFKKEHQVPYCYQNLIKKCWQENPGKRPLASAIVEQLEKNTDFITKDVDKEEFLNYVSFIKETETKEKTVESTTPQINKEIIIKNQSNRIIETEDQKDKSNGIFIDITKFERQLLISKEDTTKLYEFKNKETGEIFAGQMSMMKIKKFSPKDISNLVNKIEIILKMKHPSILKFIGYSPIDFKKQRKPVIIMEMPSNRTLKDILEIERNHNSIYEWNDTKKLMSIYGIASGMSYFHSFGIIHGNLKPSNIFIDDFLLPKIGDFGLSSDNFNNDSMTNQSMIGNKATPIYSSPEVLQFNEVSQSSDVYAFAFIVYEIITGRIPFNELESANQIFKEIVIKQKRPEIDENIHLCYRRLIEDCWSQDPKERPSFDEIVHRLKIDSEYTQCNINKAEYEKYIFFIESNTTTIELPQKIQEI